MGKTVNYKALTGQLAALTEGIPYEVANLANASALLWQEIPGLNWAGFYKMTDGALPGTARLHPHPRGQGCLRHRGGGGPNPTGL